MVERYTYNIEVAGPIPATPTKNKGPYELIYCEAYKSIKDAKYREGNLKRFSQAYTQLKRRIKNSLE